MSAGSSADKGCGLRPSGVQPSKKKITSLQASKLRAKRTALESHGSGRAHLARRGSMP
jgi:hypothetical protein